MIRDWPFVAQSPDPAFVPNRPSGSPINQVDPARFFVRTLANTVIILGQLVLDQVGARTTRNYGYVILIWLQPELAKYKDPFAPQVMMVRLPIIRLVYPTVRHPT